VIGTGLFMGSGVTINQGGPVGAILAYLVAGFLMYLVMVCLGELSVQMPVSGSFQAHATKFIGPATGFMIGWVYWMSWATTVGLEFTAAGMLMNAGSRRADLVLVGAVRGGAVRHQRAGHPRLRRGRILVLGHQGGGDSRLHHRRGAGDLRRHPAEQRGAGANDDNLIGESLFPNGLSAVFAVMMTVVYAFQGCEIMGVAPAKPTSRKRASRGRCATWCSAC
jgi:arginine/ornithine permease